MRPSRTKPASSAAHPKSSPQKDEFLYRTHKVALDPTPELECLLTRTADYARAAYNWGLKSYMDDKKAGQEPTMNALRRKWNAIKGSEFAWGKHLAQSTAHYAFDALGHAIQAGDNPRLQNTAARYHSKTWHTAFRIGDKVERVRCHDQRVQLPGIGGVRMCEPLRLSGSLQKVTIKREAGRWFACLTVKLTQEKRPDRPGRTSIGVDVGIRNMLVCSDGTVYEQYPNAKAEQRAKHQERKIKRYNKQLAEQVLGSARYERTVLKIQKARYRIQCARDDSQHKAATEVVDKAGAIGIETPDILGMTQGSGQRSPGQISGAAMSAMLYKLAYRCEAAGIKLTRADRYFPSSQLCSNCGRRQKMPMRKKEYRCPCGLVLCRDVNAAVNLKPPASTAA